MKKTFTRILVLACLGVVLPGSLTAQFNISAEFRPRFEYRDGFNALRDSTQIPYASLSGRNRLLFEFRNDKFSSRFSLQHAYVFGENNYGADTISKNTVNLYEAWFQYQFSKKFGFRVGRTELIYDDQRLMGNSNWNQKGATHDVAMVRWQLPDQGYRGDIGFAINNAAPLGAFLSSYPLKNYKYLAYFYEQKKYLKDQLVFSVIGVLDVFQKASTTAKKTTNDTINVYDEQGSVIGYTVIPKVTTTTTTYKDILYGRFTFGGTAGYTWKNLKVFIAGYYQAGKLPDGRKINAGFYGGYASYKVVKPLTLTLGYERISGTDLSDTTALKTESRSMNRLYGTGHGFYGYMEMFNSYLTNTNHSGLSDLYVRGLIEITPKTSLEATWRFFGMTQEYLPSKEGNLPYKSYNKNLGHEIDLMVIYKILDNFELNGGYCIYLPTETTEKLFNLAPGSSKFAQFAYVMLTWKPNFFNSEKK